MKQLMNLLTVERSFLIVLSIIFLSCRMPSEDPVDNDGEIGQNIYLADPTIFFHEGIYYLYGTGKSNEGFLVYTSTDMKLWEGPKGVGEGFALRKGDAYGNRGFWAPQVFFYNNKFYMVYTANESIAIAESNSPLGPFNKAKKNPWQRR